MGYPYYNLVPPAILLDNPGVTREEYIQLLDNVHTFSLCEFRESDAWSPDTKNSEDDKWHRGLEGLANILMLEETKEWKKFNQAKKDENDLWLRPPEYMPDDRSGKLIHTICIHEKNIIKPEEEVEDYSEKRLKVRQIWSPSYQCYEDKNGIIRDILNETSLIDPNTNEPFEYKYKLIITQFHPQWKDEKFASLDEMYKKWPEFKPELIYNFLQSEGEFSGVKHDLLCDKGFGWMQKDGKFYLDPKIFDKISAGSNTSSFMFGYTDLILTAEAIKNNAWKILSYRGLKHFPEFMGKFPESRKRYERAVWDSHTSLSAKLQGMTHSELLRWRLLSPDAF